MVRKLAKIETIKSFFPIKDASKIEAARISGWVVVVEKNKFEIGDKVVYFEIDSWIPHTLAPFLSKGDVKEYNGIIGNRLRTAKLRGQISQGLIIAIEDVENWLGQKLPSYEHGYDLTELLRINKWEPPVSASLAGDVYGSFPYFIPKTDAERIQNLDYDELKLQRYTITEKLNGSSMTVYLTHEDNHFGVCSRNLELKESDTNAYWQAAKKVELHKKFLQNELRDYAIQGELIGPGIQKNMYELADYEFRPFRLFNIEEQKIEPFEKMAAISKTLGLEPVPLIGINAPLLQNYEEMLQLASDKSLLNKKKEREGIVLESNDGEFLFKIISNKFLLKNG